MPAFAALMMLFAMATAAAATSGFVGEFMVIMAR